MAIACVAWSGVVQKHAWVSLIASVALALAVVTTFVLWSLWRAGPTSSVLNSAVLSHTVGALLLSWGAFLVVYPLAAPLKCPLRRVHWSSWWQYAIVGGVTGLAIASVLPIHRELPANAPARTWRVIYDRVIGVVGYITALAVFVMVVYLISGSFQGFPA
jgi:hypothetical protein